MEQAKAKMETEEEKHDHELYDRATSIDYLDWEYLNKLRNECLTEKGKKDIDDHISWLYHQEEARAGLL